MDAPKKITDVKLDFIMQHAKENGHVDWLKAKANETKKDDSGEEKAISFVELRNAYVKEFMPEIAKKKKPKKAKNFIDKINAL